VAEDTEAILPAAPEAATQAPARTANQTFVDQYEIDPPEAPEALPDASEPDTNAVPAPGPVSAPRERDPATGRCLAPAEAVPSQHSPRLVRMAKDLGLDDGEINSIPADRIEDIVYHLNKQALAQARSHSIERTLAGATERNIVNQQSDPVAPAAKPADEFDLGIDEAQYDPGLIAAIKKMGKSQDARIKELESQVSAVTQREVVRANETTADRIDRAFSKHETHLGKGKGRELAEESRDYQRRIAILAMVDRDKGKGSLESKIDHAVTNLYGAPAPAAPAKPAAAADDPELETRRRDWNNGGLARPTQRQPSDMPNGTRKAEKSVAAQLKEMGAVEESGEAGPEDFLE